MTRPYIRRAPHAPAHHPVHDEPHVTVHASIDLDIEQAPSGKTRRSMNSASTFDLHPDIIEKYNAAGWDLNFKSESVFGQQQDRSMASARENGWEEVDASKVPGFMPSTHSGPVRIEGTVLMRRPMYLSERAHEENRRNATQQISRHIRSVDVADERTKAMIGPSLTRDVSAE